MARQHQLSAFLTDDDSTTGTDQDTQQTPKSPRKKGQGSTAGRKASGTQKRAQPAKKAASKRSASSSERTEPRVLGAPAANAQRVSLYLHPDDARALQLARVEDKADANARVRAMIAVWRHNTRFRAQVDKLARTAPRGGRP